MTSYSKGRSFEYRVKRALQDQGWLVFRTAGSHSPADLIAMRTGEIWFIQCRLSGYLLPIERVGFIEIAKEQGVVPMLAYREGRKLILKEVN